MINSGFNNQVIGIPSGSGFILLLHNAPYCVNSSVRQESIDGLPVYHNE